MYLDCCVRADDGAGGAAGAIGVFRFCGEIADFVRVPGYDDTILGAYCNT